MKKQSFVNAILLFIEQHELLPDNSKIIIGLSGGPDSVFLLHLLHALKKEKNLSLIAAHLDHQWRKDSHKDVQFCHELCKKLHIDFIYTTASELPQELQIKGSKEEIGRRMRRYFLQQVCETNKADFIALGHHLQDQEETFFIRLIRGTTLSGLTCMKPRDGVYIRPLLEIKKKDIISYLDKENIDYLIDPSNISESFLRNRIRMKVLPALQECDERFDINFLRTLNNLQDSENYLKQKTEKEFFQLAHLENNTWYIDLKKLITIHPLLINRIIMLWLIRQQVPFVPSESFLEEIKHFLFRPAGKIHNVHEKWFIDKKQKIAHIKKRKD